MYYVVFPNIILIIVWTALIENIRKSVFSKTVPF